MATIRKGTRTLFFTTSPRSILRCRPELALLAAKFTGKVWNPTTQARFMQELQTTPAFASEGTSKDLSLSARDRINRAPKLFGFVDLQPRVCLTEAGKEFLDDDFYEEILLRQALKVQYPSPYHQEPQGTVTHFWVRPYLEIFRLIRELDYLSRDELMLYGLQLTDYHKFTEIVSMIKDFRQEKETHKGKYKQFLRERHDAVIEKLYADLIATGQLQVRESREISKQKFLATKRSNMRDYTDACFRHLRAMGLVTLSQRKASVRIMQGKEALVDDFLATVERNPIFVTDEAKFKAYLFATKQPKLYTDNRKNLEKQAKEFGLVVTASLSISALKKQIRQKIAARREQLLDQQVVALKKYEPYEDVLRVFAGIQTKSFYDTPLMLEYNAWRTMTMLDGGTIKPNFNFDDQGEPASTAGGNLPDVECDYGTFCLIVEVTMATGQRQYEMEGEPVARHLGQVRERTGKPTYCFFVAPSINRASIAHFYVLHHLPVALYGGKIVIIPLPLSAFQDMLRQSHDADFAPDASYLQRFCEKSREVAASLRDTENGEMAWYEQMLACAKDWLHV